MFLSGPKDSGNLSFRGWVIVVLVFLFTIFVLQNTEVVEVTFLFWHIMLSRVILLLGALVAGALMGLLIGWEFRRQRKKTGGTPDAPQDR